jgi:hypothetical protein
LIVVHDGIQQAIFQCPAIFPVFDEHREVIVLPVIGPLQWHYLRV